MALPPLKKLLKETASPIRPEAGPNYGMDEAKPRAKHIGLDDAVRAFPGSIDAVVDDLDLDPEHDIELEVSSGRLGLWKIDPAGNASLPHVWDQNKRRWELRDRTMSEAYIGFNKLKGKLARGGGVKNPAALAASIGRKKYGKKAMTKKSAAGRRKHKNEGKSHLMKFFEARFPDEKFWNKDGEPIHPPAKGTPPGATGLSSKDLGVSDDAAGNRKVYAASMDTSSFDDKDVLDMAKKLGLKKFRVFDGMIDVEGSIDSIKKLMRQLGHNPDEIGDTIEPVYDYDDEKRFRDFKANNP